MELLNRIHNIFLIYGTISKNHLVIYIHWDEILTNIIVFNNLLSKYYILLF